MGRASSPRAARAAAFALLAVLVGVRLFAAWMLRTETNPDCAIVLLMVRHVLAGGPWPVFFYGQAYMGSLEPLTSAACAWLGGFSAFAVNVGTALYAIAALIVTAHWARHLGGWRAAAGSLALCASGPFAYVHYMASPRGGYGTLLFFTMLVLGQGARLLERERTPSPPGCGAYLLLGAAAGLGFWCNFLLAPAIGAVAAAFLLWRRLAAFRLRIVGGTVAGFAIGSAPLWWWNLMHRGATFAMSQSLSPSPAQMRRNLASLVGERLPQLLDVADVSLWTRVALLLAFAACVLPAWSALSRPRHAHAAPAVTLHLSVVALYLLAFVACFCSSQFARLNTPRYLLPLVPLFALLAGLGLALARPRALRLAALLGLVALVGWQARQWPALRAHAAVADARAARYARVAALLRERGVGAAYGAYVLHMLNVIGDERTVISDPRIERYPPFAEQIERDPSPAVLENMGSVQEWVPATLGTVDYDVSTGMRMHLNFRAPVGALREVPPALWAEVSEESGRACGDRLHDRRQDTGLLLDRNRVALTVRFSRPVALAGVRLWGTENTRFSGWSIEGRAASEGPFAALSTEIAPCGFFWSGPRIYWMGPHARQELRFAPREVIEARVVFRREAHQPAGVIPEVQFLTLEAAAVADEREPDLALLMRLLVERGITRLYADRWVANRVYDAGGGRIWTQRDPRILPPATPGEDLAHLRLDASSAILMPPAGVPALRDALTARRLTLRERDLGPLGVLFDVDPAAPPPPAVSGISLAGAYAWLSHDDRWAADRLERDRGERTPEHLDYLLAAAPEFLPALRARAGMPDVVATPDRAAALQARIRALTLPEQGARSLFGRHYTWLGCRLQGPGGAVLPGGTFRLRHYWLADRPPAPESLAVFVHFIGPGGYRFQDDHVLPADLGSDPAAPRVIDRVVTVPPDAPAGSYELRIGLCHANLPAKRLSVRSTLPQRRRAVGVANLLRVPSAAATPQNPP